jgi:hypothetical protein
MSVKGGYNPSLTKEYATYIHKSEAGQLKERLKNFDKHQQRLWEIQNKARSSNVLNQVELHAREQQVQRQKHKLEYKT